jgi:hypothetical protein
VAQRRVGHRAARLEDLQLPDILWADRELDEMQLAPGCIPVAPRRKAYSGAVA